MDISFNGDQSKPGGQRRTHQQRRQRVLIVDDSRAMQRLVRHALENDPRLNVVGAASDAYQAREMIKKLDPDVLILDVEMPRMSGLDFLERLMRLRPTPVVMFSSITQIGSDAAIRALVLGAVDCVAKPVSGITPSILAELADRVHAAASARVLPATANGSKAPVPKPMIAPSMTWGGDVILIGASTGGVTAIETVLRSLPVQSAPVVIAQHMPESFLTSFAHRLDSVLAQSIHLASDGTELAPGHVYLSPGGRRHTGIARRGAKLICTEIDAPKRNGHRPSVDTLFFSAVPWADQTIGIILTGLGRDGAEGLKALRDGGGYCIGQDEESSVVYGMPRVAAELDALDEQLPLDSIADGVQKHRSAKALQKRGA